MPYYISISPEKYIKQEYSAIIQFYGVTNEGVSENEGGGEGKLVS